MKTIAKLQGISIGLTLSVTVLMVAPAGQVWAFDMFSPDGQSPNTQQEISVPEPDDDDGDLAAEDVTSESSASDMSNGGPLQEASGLSPTNALTIVGGPSPIDQDEIDKEFARIELEQLKADLELQESLLLQHLGQFEWREDQVGFATIRLNDAEDHETDMRELFEELQLNPDATEEELRKAEQNLRDAEAETADARLELEEAEELVREHQLELERLQAEIQRIKTRIEELEEQLS